MNKQYSYGYNKNSKSYSQTTNSTRIRITPVIPNESVHSSRFSQTTLSQAYSQCSVDEQKAKKLETEIDGLRNEIKLLKEHLQIAEDKFQDYTSRSLGVQISRTFEPSSSSIGAPQRKKAQEIARMKNESSYLNTKITSLQGILSKDSINDLR